MSSANKKSHFFFRFFFLTEDASRTSSTLVHKSSKSRYSSCLVPDLKGGVISLSLLSTLLAVDFS